MSFLESKFTTTANPKDGYCLNVPRDPRAKLVLRFLNPIFHPQKPKRIISKWAATFFGAMWKKIIVDSAELVQDMVDRMVKNIRKVKKARTPLLSYIVHLYPQVELLSRFE